MGLYHGEGWVSHADIQDRPSREIEYDPDCWIISFRTERDEIFLPKPGGRVINKKMFTFVLYAMLWPAIMQPKTASDAYTN